MVTAFQHRPVFIMIHQWNEFIGSPSPCTDKPSCAPVKGRDFFGDEYNSSLSDDIEPTDLAECGAIRPGDASCGGWGFLFLNLQRGFVSMLSGAYSRGGGQAVAVATPSLLTIAGPTNREPVLALPAGAITVSWVELGAGASSWVVILRDNGMAVLATATVSSADVCTESANERSTDGAGRALVLQSCWHTLRFDPKSSLVGQDATVEVGAMTSAGQPVLTPFALSVSEMDAAAPANSDWVPSSASVSIILGPPFPLKPAPPLATVIATGAIIGTFGGNKTVCMSAGNNTSSVTLVPCTTSVHEQSWQLLSSGEIHSAPSGRCLDGALGGIGQPVYVNGCVGHGGGQVWSDLQDSLKSHSIELMSSTNCITEAAAGNGMVMAKCGVPGKTEGVWVLPTAAPPTSLKTEGRQLPALRAKLDDELADASLSDPCPCVPKSLCRPLSPQPAKTRPEVVAYHGSEHRARKPPNAWSATGVFNNGSKWRTYDWTKVTSIGLFAAMSGAEGWDLLCTAHKHNVRVLPWSGEAWGRANPIVQPYEAYRYSHVEVFSNHSHIDANAKQAAAFVVASGFDGILLDAEGLRADSATMPAGAEGRLRKGLVYWASRLRNELDSALPGAVLTWTVNSNATAGDTVGKTYDYTNLSPSMDFFQPMEYCLSGDVPVLAVGLGPTAAAHARSHRIYYSSRSNDPLWSLNQTVQTFAALGIDKRKLVLLLPWFGSDFVCASTTNCSELVWSPQDPAWFGGQCGQALDGGPSLGQALALHQNATALGHSVADSISWDAASATNYFDWINTTKNHSAVADGHRHQLWFDNPRSFGLKVSLAKDLGFHGIGIWLPELVSSAAEAQEMWAAIPSPFDRSLKSDDDDNQDNGAIHSSATIPLIGAGWTSIGGAWSLDSSPQNDGIIAAHAPANSATSECN
jgi:hypothetical protein